LTVWNQRLAEVGAAVSARRAELVQILAEPLARVHRQLVPDQPAVELAYRGVTEPGDAVALLERIEGRRTDEWARGQTLVGPQRDDLRLRLDGDDLRRFGSQGQVRTAALALKLALLDAASTRSGDAPLFVLDDLGSELDPRRNEALLGLLTETGEQVFVATTSLEHLPLARDRYRAIEVRGGRCFAVDES
jgi:DNA replication and repair protein RecF